MRYYEKLFLILISIGILIVIFFNFYLKLNCNQIEVVGVIDKIKNYKISRKTNIKGHFYLDKIKYSFDDNIQLVDNKISHGYFCSVKFCPIHPYFNKEVIVSSIESNMSNLSIYNNYPNNYYCNSISNKSWIYLFFQNYSLHYMIFMWIGFSFFMTFIAYIFRK